MKRNRLIFYAVFAVFHLFLVFFAFYVESNKNNFIFLNQMLQYISVMKYGAFLGLILLIVDVLWDRSSEKEHARENGALTHELNTLKAKLFDLQEAAKVSASKEIK